MEGCDVFFSALRPLYSGIDTKCSVQGVLDNINSLFGVSSSSLTLTINNSLKSMDFTYHTGVDKNFSDYYTNKRYNIDPILDRATKYALDQGFTMADLCCQYPRWGKIHKSSFLSFGYKDALLVNFYSQQGDRGVLVLRSDPNRGEFKKADTHSISLLSPLLRMALQEHFLLCDQVPTDFGLLNTFDNSATAIFYLSKSRRLIQANAEGYRILNRGDGMSLHNNNLKLHDSYSDVQLKKFLADVFSAPYPKTELMKIQREQERFYVARIVAGNVNVLHDNGAVLIVRDPFRDIRSESLLCALFDLTSREASVATHLGNGEKLGHIAIKNGVSINTVKSQRNIIYGKMGINNQMQLVRIICSLGMLMESNIQMTNDNFWTLSSLRDALLPYKKTDH